MGALALVTAALAPALGEPEIAMAAMAYLLVVLVAAAAYGYAVGMCSAVLADVFLNFFFIPPGCRCAPRLVADRRLSSAVYMTQSLLRSRTYREAIVWDGRTA